MRTVSPALAAHFAAGRAGWSADLYTIRLASGVTLRWTGSDVPVTWGGVTYLVGPGIERGKVRWSLGLEVGELPLTIIPRAVDQVGAVPLASALRRGDFDGAGVRLDRAYAPRGGDPIVGVIDGYFSGRIGPIEGDGAEFICTVRDPRADLDKPFPANIVQPQCSNRLFDAVCGLNAATFRLTGSVTGGVTANRAGFQTSLNQPTGYFTLGRLRWTSGANAGRSGPVRTHSAVLGALSFAVGWPDAVLAGDAFEIWPGCDKRRATCISKFSNLPRFRGFPFVPSPETTT